MLAKFYERKFGKKKGLLKVDLSYNILELFS